jgi:hypothetical protein
LLSSCNTRKGLDAFFEIPFQKTLNVSKANLQQNKCTELDWSQVEFNKKVKPDFEENHLSSSNSHLTTSTEVIIPSYSSRRLHIHSKPYSKLPLYLLYLQLKVDII